MVSSIHGLDEAAALARWRALWEDSPQRSCFSTPAYAQAVVAAFGLQAEMHLVADAGADVAGALVFWRRRGPYRVVVVPPFTQFTPLVLRAAQEAHAVHARQSPLEALLATLETRFAVLRFFCPAITDLRPARWRHWRVTPYYTYRLALSGEADLPARWSGGTRRLFRKHADEFVLEERPEAIAAVVQLCADGYARHERRFPADPTRLISVFESMQAAGWARLFTAAPATGAAPEAGVAVLQDGQTAHHWIVGSRPGPSMTVLLGHLLPRLQADGVQAYDFVGANTPSIAEYKRKFGGDLVAYHYLEKVMRPELRLYYSLKA